MSYTGRVLSAFHTPELKLHGPQHESRIEWIKKDINKFPRHPLDIDFGPDPSNGSLQQTDLLRKFYLTIAIYGLQYAYNQQLFGPGNLPKPAAVPEPLPVPDKKVIIVGAGMSGLVAGYELRKAGYDVEILEMSQRYGGRVKTLDQKDGFDSGLHTDAGAMRLPQTPDKDRPISELIHYLTDFYALKRFQLNPVPFSNFNENAFYNFYGQRTKISEWQNSQFSVYWPGWDAKWKESGCTNIKNINDYFEKTSDCVVGLLEKRLKDIPSTDIAAQAEQWDLWSDNWSQFSFGSFLRSNVTAIKSMLEYDNIIKEDDPLLTELEKYLPWPEIAITAYSVFNYTLAPDVSLVAILQDGMGKWWSDRMHSLEGGLSALPNAFATQGGMEPLITYNRSVMKVEYTWTDNFTKSVKVSGVITSSGQPFCVEGRSVILTTPLHVLRGIQIVNSDPAGLPFPKEFQQAIQDISYSPSTKIMLQYKQQFWNTGTNPKTDITGGFSKTNMPIGQLHYPTEVVVVPAEKKAGVGSKKKAGVVSKKKARVGSKELVDAWEPKPVTPDQKGILMVYTWKAEALLWGALSEDQAVALAVEQIDLVHPETDTKALFQVAQRQAWASDPTTLGAFAMLRPQEYISIMFLMQNSWKNMYFGGEAISFANGWIQGALESGLRAAYELFRDDQPVL